jgi:hypothetical protein
MPGSWRRRAGGLGWVVLALGLAACGGDDSGAGSIAAPVAREEMASFQPPDRLEAALGQTVVSADAPAPRIAYSYNLQFRVPADGVAAAQARHVAMCDALEAARCRVVALDRQGDDGQFVSGSLALQVESASARTFADAMEAAVVDAGGRTTGRGQQAEDLARQIVDVEARLAAKQALADRLRALIERPGAKVGELVEAERAFAEAQADLDSARFQLELLQRQVAMSRITAFYQGSRPAGSAAGAPIAEALARTSQTLGRSIGALIFFLVLALPWVLLIALLLWAVRRWRRSRLPPAAPPD